jgi:hypothetical protein
MRRIALVCLKMVLPALSLSGCGYASSPFTGFGNFVGDTHTVSLRANMPVGDSENVRRVTGREVAVEPLLPEPGNIWPGPPPPEPTLEDIERQQNNGQPIGGVVPPYNGMPPGTNPAMPPGQLPGQPVAPHPQPRPYTRGSSTPPGTVPTQTFPPVAGPAPLPQGQRAPQPPGGMVQTPQGPVTMGPNTGGVQTYSVPGGGTGIVVPNGNGTSTLVGPDGSVQTVPNQR